MRLPYRFTTELAVIFLTAFIIVAFMYAFLAAFTNIFYKKRRDVELSYIEQQIKSGEATVGQRVSLFWPSVFGSLVVPQCYIAAAVLTSVYWFFYYYKT